MDYSMPQRLTEVYVPHSPLPDFSGLMYWSPTWSANDDFPSKKCTLLVTLQKD